MYELTIAQLRAERRSADRTLRRIDEALQQQGCCPCGGVYQDLPAPPPGLVYTATYVARLTWDPPEDRPYYVPPAPIGKRCPDCGAWTPVPSVVCNNTIGPAR